MAQTWREAIDQRRFSITVWYRLSTIERATWKQNPHWDPVPMLAHDIAISVDVLKFEASTMSPVDSSKTTETTPEQSPKPENPDAIARKTADDYIRSIEKKGLLKRAVFSGIYCNSKGKDSYAVSYTVAEVNRKAVPNQPVHVFVLKDKANEWRISAFSSDGIHVALGPPPAGFVRVATPKAPK